ncbi:hypothetical protein C1145_10245 [Clostridium botulinum]|nr:hypothetical protein C1145_10245 [Clostridium botulinum]RFM22328.1 hypothetical protein C1146_00890 [Clostridium botulinum]
MVKTVRITVIIKRGSFYDQLGWQRGAFRPFYRDEGLFLLYYKTIKSEGRKYLLDNPINKILC